MITTEGALHIKRYLAGQVGSMAEVIALGIATNAESAADTYMGFEIQRTDIDLVSYDYDGDAVVFKATLPDDLDGTIYEIGLFSEAADEKAGDYGSRIITSFDSDTEDWTGGAFDATNTRIGTNNLRLTPGANATMSSQLDDLFLDLSGNSNADTFLLAYNAANTFTSNVTVRFMTDASNYYSITVVSPGGGYHVDAITKGNASVTGTPDWADINSIQVRATSTSGGAAVVDLDGIRIEDVDTSNPDYVLVARELLATPYNKVSGRTEEIEFSLPVSVG